MELIRCLAITKEDYLSCDIRNPRVSLTGRDSIFKFGHSGPFFFISSNVECYQKGQKLHIVVMAERHKHVVLPPPASPPLVPSPKAESPSAANNNREIEKLKLSELTCRQGVIEVAKIIYGVHDEAKDKEFELELSWVCEESNRQHQKVPDELLEEAKEAAKLALEEMDAD